jgi:hypothetical protein
MSTIVKTRKKVSKAEEQADRAALALKAYKLRLQGRSLWDVSEECQVPERAIGSMINDHLYEAAQLIGEGARRELLALEVDRLDQLQSGIWRLAMSGDLPAIDRVIKIIHERASLLNLNDGVTTSVTNNTVVVAGTGPDYIAALQAYARTPLAIEE